MPSIRADLAEIKKEINDISKEAREAAKNTKAVNEELRFDPTNIKAIADRFTKLRAELNTNNKLITTLESKLEELKGLKKKFAGDEAALRQINTLIADYTVKLDYAREANVRFERQSSKVAEQQQIVAAATKQAEEKFSKLEKAAQKVSVITIALVAVFARLSTELIKQSTELTALATRYNTNVESIQTWNRALYSATGQANLFTNSLSVMSKGMAQIAAGRGVAYQQALRNIGIAYKDIADLSTSEQFETIVEALGNIESASARSEAALTLLGDSGQYIAGIFEQDSASISTYLEEAKQFAVITTENAERMKDLGIELEAAKSYLQLIGTEVLVALLPLFELFADIVKGLAPLIKGMANNLGALGKVGQATLVVFGIFIAILPIFVGLLKSLNIASIAAASGVAGVGKAAAVANVALAKWQIILTAIAAVVLLVTQLIGMFINKAQQANNEMSALVNAQNALGNMSGELNTNTQSITTSQTEKTVNVGVEIYGHGDTDISDEAAINVAQLTVDQIQKALGDLTK